MIKKLIRYICYRVYLTGKFEHFSRTQKERNLVLSKIATLDSTAVLTQEVNIVNHQQDKSKIVIGKETRVRGELMVLNHGGSIEIGDYCFIGPQTRIWSSKKIVIGNRVLISHNVNIHDNISHPLDAALRHKDFINIFTQGHQGNVELREAEIIIEDDAWIGFNCIILKGVKIGKGAIIGAGSTITKDIPAYAVVAGNPPQIVKRLDQ